MSRSSHNAGENCRSCHHPDGPGEVCWNIGGTIYDQQGTGSVVGAEVRLFGGPEGSGGVKYQLQSDQNGNVYTSANLTFGAGLFPAVINASGDTVFMSGAVSDGACNRCHGQSTDRIELP